MTSFWKQLWRGKTAVRAGMNLTLERLPPFAGRILDLGGGKKPLPSYREALSLAPNGEVVTLDINPAAAPDVVADASRIPLANQSFDWVWCFNLLEHVMDPAAVLHEIHRVLKPGGQVILFTPFLVRVHGHPQDFARYTDTALRALLEPSGFLVEEIRAIAPGPWTAAMAQIQPVIPRFIFFIGSLLAWMFDRLVYRFRPNLAQAWPLGYFSFCRKS